MSNIETLREMAKLTMLSNKLNEIQLKNLKMFPLVFFDGIKEAQIEYDLSNHGEFNPDEEKSFGTNHLYVQYNLTIKKNAKNLKKNKRFEALESSVRAIFWPEVKVIVYINGKLAFESE